MLEKTGRYRNLAEPFHCDFNNELFFGHLGNHLLNAADFHSNDRGFGMVFLNTIGKTWVLSRLVIEIERMPRIYEEFFVETWVENAMRFFTNRNFHILSSAGETLGWGRSVWAMIDTETRQPVNLLEVKDGEMELWVEKEKENPISKPTRVRMSNEAQLVDEITARYNDVDINGHVNSVKYIERVLDILPPQYYRQHRLRRIDIAYVAESHGGDKLRFYREDDADGGILVSVRKLTGEDETECVRCKLTFELR